MTHADESVLVERARTDPDAFGTLYDRYMERIYSYAARQTGDVAAAQDITAATFEKALRHIRRFQWRNIGFAPWLYRIASNEIAQHYRNRRFTVAWGERDEAEPVGVMPGGNGARPPEARVLAMEQSGMLARALRGLSAADRDVLTLRFLEGLSTDDVAAVLGCSRDNVYVRLHRALARLRQQLERLEGMEANRL